VKDRKEQQEGTDTCKDKIAKNHGKKKKKKGKMH
jgi:hypothetical protein